MVPGLLFFPAMPASEPTLKLRPAVRRPIRRGEIAIAATVLCASASGGVLVALLQPRAETPAVLTLPVPTAIAVPTHLPVSQPAEGSPPPLFPDLAPVIADGGLRLVMATEVEPKWLGEAIEVHDHGGVRVVTRPLSRLGEERFAGGIDARVRLHGRDARLCTAEVTGFVAVGRFAPDDFEVGDPPADAAAAWKAAEGSHLIAADLRPIDGDCAGALWAQPDGLAEPVRATIAAASAEQTRLASEQLKTSSQYMEVAGSGELAIEFQATIIATDSEQLLVASALGEGCVGLEPFTTAIYALQADGSLHPVGTGLHVISIEAAADFDGDGHLEILFRSDDADLAILRRRAGAYQVEAHAAVPIYGCRC